MHPTVPCRLSLPVLLGLSLGAQAQTGGESTPMTATELDQITVSATRSARAVGEVAGTVTVIDETEIDRRLARDIEDLVRYEPGVSVDDAGRFGLTGFRIRGIGGDRVLTLIDGIRIADEFSFGPFQDANRDFIDVDALKAVEIVRGPASALYGSDAIGGVVTFVTKDPADYLGIFDQDHYFSAKAGYGGEDDGRYGTLTLAGERGTLAGLLLYTRREGHESRSFGGQGGDGPQRQQADPQDYYSDNLLAKLVLTPAGPHRLKLTMDHFQGETDTELRSAVGTAAMGVETLTETGQDQRERTRYSLDYAYTGAMALFDQARLTLYRQDSETRQLTEQLRAGARGTNRRLRDSSFDQVLEGVSFQLDRNRTTGGVSHYLTYGGEYYSVTGDNLRDGATFDAASGTSIPEFSPFPTRAFPNSETRQYALYLQDEIGLLNGRLTLIPGLRYDRYELDAEEDFVYREGNPGVAAPEDFGDSRLSPKLGAVLRLDPVWSLFAQYAEGFRAPPYDDVNVGFTNLAGGYKTVPNGRLKPEESQGLEVGLRGRGAAGSLSLAAFYNHYDNFIESLAPQGVDPADGLLVFQAENRGEVVIQGLELKGELFLDTFSPELAGWGLNAAIAYARGDDRDLDQPLNSVDPLKGVFGLAYQAPSRPWGGELVWTLARGKNRLDESAGEPFRTPGYGVLDLLGWYRLGEHLEFNAGLFNLTDQRYWRWSEELLGRAPTDPGLARLTEPGRSLTLSLKAEW